MDGSTREFKFRAEDKETATRWFNTIEVQIRDSEGVMEEKSAEGLRKPWRFDNISETQFKREADTGDLLLFRSNQAVAKIARGYTKSHFDHVAMLLKFEADPGEVYLLEATGNCGVALNKWCYIREHIGKSKFYDKVVFRHITFDRGDTMIDNLQKFLSQVVGNKYGLSANKLTRTESVDCTDLGIDKNGEQRLIAADRTFFCSELVAKAYKILGIIEDDNKSSAKYFPSHFSSMYQNALKLTEGTTMDHELLVIMDREDLLNTNDSDKLPHD